MIASSQGCRQYHPFTFILSLNTLGNGTEKNAIYSFYASLKALDLLDNEFNTFKRLPRSYEYEKIKTAIRLLLSGGKKCPGRVSIFFLIYLN